MKQIFVALAILFVVAVAGHGQEPATLFPRTGEVPGWTTSGAPRTFSADNLWEYIDGDAEKYVQAGVRKTLTQDYKFKNKIEAVVDIYVMSAPAGARKVFDSWTSSGATPARIGDASQLTKTSLTFRKGAYFVKMIGYQESPDLGGALVGLGKAVEARLK